MLTIHLAVETAENGKKELVPTLEIHEANEEFEKVVLEMVNHNLESKDISVLIKREYIFSDHPAAWLRLRLNENNQIEYVGQSWNTEDPIDGLPDFYLRTMKILMPRMYAMHQVLLNMKDDPEAGTKKLLKLFNEAPANLEELKMHEA